MVTQTILGMHSPGTSIGSMLSRTPQLHCLVIGGTCRALGSMVLYCDSGLLPFLIVASRTVELCLLGGLPLISLGKRKRSVETIRTVKRMALSKPRNQDGSYLLHRDPKYSSWPCNKRASAEFKDYTSTSIFESNRSIANQASTAPRWLIVPNGSNNL